MSLNIKNERVHALAREAAARSGETQTSVIEKALEKYLDELDATEAKRRARIDLLLADIDRRVKATQHLAISVEDLYDPATGLPA